MKQRIKTVLVLLAVMTLTGCMSVDYRISDLHRAVEANNTAEVQRLLDGGANVNAGDIAGQTPLIYAAYGGHNETIKILLERGAASVVHDARELAEAVLVFLRNPEISRRQGELARQAVASHRGAAGQTATLLQKLMLIKRWGSEVKNWRSETLSGASSKPSGNPAGMLDDWPEWPL